MNENYPYHIRRRLGFNSPEQFRKLFELFPLNSEFIDWVVEQGFKIFYKDNFYAGMGCTDWQNKEIWISPKGDSKLIRLVKVHELIHVALVGTKFKTRTMDEQEKYEKTIDEIAQKYVDNEEFIRSMETRIPHITEQ